MLALLYTLHIELHYLQTMPLDQRTSPPPFWDEFVERLMKEVKDKTEEKRPKKASNAQGKEGEGQPSRKGARLRRELEQLKSVQEELPDTECSSTDDELDEDLTYDVRETLVHAILSMLMPCIFSNSS